MRKYRKKPFQMRNYVASTSTSLGDSNLVRFRFFRSVRTGQEDFQQKEDCTG